MKIQYFRQTCAGRTDRLTPCAPDGDKNETNECKLVWGTNFENSMMMMAASPLFGGPLHKILMQFLYS